GAVNPKSFWYSSVSRIGVPYLPAGAPDASPIPPYPHESLKTLFDDIRALTRYLCFESFEALLDFMLKGLEIDAPDSS
ncbi:MAG: hypothetical protein ACYCXX_14075, partial [Acidiferrobacter thiooxydans]